MKPKDKESFKQKQMATIECAVCFETKGVTVCCAKCAGSSCQGCFQSYLLNSTLTPTCMHCKASLSDDFVLAHTALAWRNTKYKIYKENLLFDMEKARLPGTQVYAEVYMKARQLTGDAQKALKTIDEAWLTEPKAAAADVMATQMQMWDYESRTHRHKSVISWCKRPISSYGLVAWGGIGTVQQEAKRAVIKACITTGCSGFLNADFSCGLCNVKVCKACHEATSVAGEDHVCNEDTVATIKAIKAEARGCPTCATLISKIDGCDQMWCTRCQTTFSWRTGQVEAGHTHNPHYYEYMRKNGGLPRAPGDAPAAAVCGFPRLTDLQNALMTKELKGAILLCGHENLLKSGSESEKLTLKLLDMHRHFIHVEEAVRRRLAITPVDNHELRVQYLTKELTESKLKQLLQQRDKAHRKSVAKNQIYQMAYTVAGDLYRSLIQAGKQKEKESFDSLNALMAYSNNCLDKVAASYSCVVTHYEVIA